MTEPHSFRSKYNDPHLELSGACVDCGVTADAHDYAEFKRGEMQAVRDLMCNHDAKAIEAEATAAAEQRLRASVEEAESDAPEEARRFVPPFEGGFREGARWALNRWRSAILEPSSERPTVTPVSEMFEPNAKPRTGPKPDLWGNPNRAARMRSGAPHGDWFVVSGLCKTCGEPYPCVASEEPLPTQASDSPEKTT